MWSTVVGYISILVLVMIIKGPWDFSFYYKSVYLFHFIPLFSDGINRLTEGRECRPQIPEDEACCCGEQGGGGHQPTTAAGAATAG
jgi:hypothetical protein